MTKSEAIEQIQKICNQPENFSDENLSKLEAVLKKYLAEHPTDSDMWLRFVMVEFSPPREDPERMEKYLNHVLSYEPNNIKAALILAYVQDFHYGHMTPETFAILNSLVSNDPEHLSMIEFAKSWYCENTNEKKYLEHLKKSIEYYNKHVRNYESLANYYFQKSKKQQAKKLLQKALDNIQHIYGETYDNKDTTDIEEFFNYYYKNTHAMDWQRRDMKKLLKS